MQQYSSVMSNYYLITENKANSFRSPCFSLSDKLIFIKFQFQLNVWF